MKVFELIPYNQKSFYGKAKVRENWNKTVTLISYDTEVCSIDTKNNKFIRQWPGYSLTTMNHINSFRKLYGFPVINKKDWEMLPIETLVY